MRELQIIVCVKQVPDPEGPADAFKVDPEAKKVTPVGIPPLINPFDENALEVALRIKDHHSAKVIVISMGEKLAQPVLRKTLACGADDLILLMDSCFKDLDSYSTAYVLSTAIKGIDSYDLILTGRHAADWDFGVTGLIIAEMLRIPGINVARKVEIREDSVLVEKLSDDGYEVVKASIPALVTMSNEAGELRNPNFKAILDAVKKPIQIYNAENLKLDLQKLAAREIFGLSTFQSRRQCYFLEGESSQGKGENLAVKIKEDGVI